jgi:hypothetical protein
MKAYFFHFLPRGDDAGGAGSLGADSTSQKGSLADPALYKEKLAKQVEVRSRCFRRIAAAYSFPQELSLPKVRMPGSNLCKRNIPRGCF